MIYTLIFFYVSFLVTPALNQSTNILHISNWLSNWFITDSRGFKSPTVGAPNLHSFNQPDYYFHVLLYIHHSPQLPFCRSAALRLTSNIFNRNSATFHECSIFREFNISLGKRSPGQFIHQIFFLFPYFWLQYFSCRNFAHQCFFVRTQNLDPSPLCEKSWW